MNLDLNRIHSLACEKLNDVTWDDKLFDLSCLMQECFGVSREELAIKGSSMPDMRSISRFWGLFERYVLGEPLQYLLGEWEFYGLPFNVGAGVLIPRPDTETLVEISLKLISTVKFPCVADLCSGSGCVATSISSIREDADVYALELSGDAFTYLCSNIKRNSSHVKPLQCDVLSPPSKVFPPLDLVVSNPPYLSALELNHLPIQVSLEPKIALDGGDDGYHFYREIPILYYPIIKYGGFIAFEVGYTQAAHVCTILSELFSNVTVYKDLAGVERVVTAQKI